MAYPSSHVMFFLDTMTSSEISLPIPSSTSAGVGALSGLGGYMTLGLGTKAKPLMTELGSEEVLIPKDSMLHRYRFQNHVNLQHVDRPWIFHWT